MFPLTEQPKWRLLMEKLPVEFQIGSKWHRRGRWYIKRIKIDPMITLLSEVSISKVATLQSNS